MTSVMKAQLINGLEARWLGSLLALRDDELATIIGWFPHLRATVADLRALPCQKIVSETSPLILHDMQDSPVSRSRTGLLTCVVLWWTILGLNQ